MLNIVGVGVVVALRCCVPELLADGADDVLALASAFISFSSSSSCAAVVVIAPQDDCQELLQLL